MRSVDKEFKKSFLNLSVMTTYLIYGTFFKMRLSSVTFRVKCSQIGPEDRSNPDTNVNANVNCVIV